MISTGEIAAPQGGGSQFVSADILRKSEKTNPEERDNLDKGFGECASNGKKAFKWASKETIELTFLPSFWEGISRKRKNSEENTSREGGGQTKAFTMLKIEGTILEKGEVSSHLSQRKSIRRVGPMKGGGGPGLLGKSHRPNRLRYP